MVLLKPGFTPRRYQEAILASAAQQNTLVVLPTGMGKTAIAAMLAAHRLDKYANSKILFLAPTRPLVQQHLDTFKNMFDFPDESFALFTGHVTPTKRVKLWEQATFIFSTPQGMENDVISRKVDLKDVSLLVFDEAHRAVGDYAYVYLAENYHEHGLHERILGLTASPGSDEETIKEVCDHLFVEDIEVRSQEDPDVREYVQELDITFKNVPLSESLTKARDYLKQCYEHKLAGARELGVLTSTDLNKTGLLKAQSALHAKMAQGDKSYEVLKTISLLAEALKVQHALELCETQTISALVSYLQSLQQQATKSKTKAVQNLVKDPDFKSALMVAERLLETGEEHPKLTALQSLVTQELIDDAEKKIIIFTQFRDTANVIKQRLGAIASAEIFVGQAKKNGTGLSQKEQQAVLQRFREADFQVLIATSVAEEGLDIPAVDTVVFYEPIPSAIRTVQRRGRTARHDSGKMYMLIAKGTRDEGYRWSAHHKEKRMYRTLAKMKKNFTPTTRTEQPTLQSYAEPQQGVTITVDHREKGSATMKALLAQHAKLDLAQLPVGDYRIGEDIVVEYKNVRDFVDSIVDGRLLGQLAELRTTYKPLLIIEGMEDLYAQRKINPAAIRGMLATIVTSYHIPLLRTVSPADTAGVLLALAKREAKKEDGTRHPHTAKPWTLQEQQEYVIASLPGIGPKLAKPLLEKFGSVSKVLNASLEELQEVELIGRKKAEAIKELLDAKYG